MDRFTGYRYYQVEQIDTMNYIQRLKRYGFSLEEIQQIITLSDEKEISGILRQQRDKLKHEQQETAMDFETSHIYPGIPEYFRGEAGDLVIEPKLMGEQFDSAGKASVSFRFAGRQFSVTYVNLAGRDYGEYRMEKALLTVAGSPRMQKLPILRGKALLIRAEVLVLPRLGNRYRP